MHDPLQPPPAYLLRQQEKGRRVQAICTVLMVILVAIPIFYVGRAAMVSFVMPSVQDLAIMVVWTFAVAIGYSFAVVATRWRVLRIQRHALELDGRMCTTCGYELTRDEHGICPECGVAFTHQANEEAWDRARPPFPTFPPLSPKHEHRRVKVDDAYSILRRSSSIRATSTATASSIRGISPRFSASSVVRAPRCRRPTLTTMGS